MQQADAQNAQACQLNIFARDVDQTYGTDDRQLISMFTKTFSLSPQTTFDQLLRSACQFWGVIGTDFEIYQLVDEEPIPLQASSDRVCVVLEELAIGSSKGVNKADKKGGDDTSAKLHAVFYIGRNHITEKNPDISNKILAISGATETNNND